jgi:VCBS repeat protein
MFAMHISGIRRCVLLRTAIGFSVIAPAACVAGTAPVSSLIIRSNAPVSGNNTRGVVTLSSPAQGDGASVTLSSSNAKVAMVPTSVEIQAGSKTATFTIKIGIVSRATTVKIEATSGSTQSAALIVNPAATVSWKNGAAPSFPLPNQCFAGDFNSDGKTDLACYTSIAGRWNVVLSTGHGWKSEFWNGGPGPALPVSDQCVTGDFNGDGRTDLACWTGEGGSWNVALSTGSGWQSEFWNGGPLLVDEWNVVPISGQCFAADFNGDGKMDLACSDGVDGAWSVSLSTGRGWNTESWSGGPVVPLPMTQQCVSGDFNGDRKADLACWTGEGGGWAVALSTGKSWRSSIWNGGPSPVYEWNVMSIGQQCFAADFNGDGKTDLTCYTLNNGVWSVALSSGKQW